MTAFIIFSPVYRMGELAVELYWQHAPNTCRNFAELSRRGYYNGTKFHRYYCKFGLIEVGKVPFDLVYFLVIWTVFYCFSIRPGRGSCLPIRKLEFLSTPESYKSRAAKIWRVQKKSKWVDAQRKFPLFAYEGERQEFWTLVQRHLIWTSFELFLL